jgi:hypothetical protein
MSEQLAGSDDGDPQMGRHLMNGIPQPDVMLVQSASNGFDRHG